MTAAPSKADAEQLAKLTKDELVATILLQKREIAQLKQDRVANEQLLHAVYTDAASAAMQLSDLKQQVSAICRSSAAAMRQLVTAVVQHHGIHAVRKQLSKATKDELASLRASVLDSTARAAEGLAEMAASFVKTGAIDSREPHIVKDLHRAVMALCSSPTRDRLHRLEEFTAVAPMSWNTATRLVDAVPHAITALQMCSEYQDSLQTTVSLLRARLHRAEQSEKRIASEWTTLSSSLGTFLEEQYRKHGLTRGVVFGLTAESSTELPTATELVASLHHLERMLDMQQQTLQSLSASRSPPCARCSSLQDARLAEAEPSRARGTAGHEALLRKRVAQLRFRLAAQLVRNFLLKVRCRRVLTISQSHYRTLRKRLSVALRTTQEQQGELEELRAQRNRVVVHQICPFGEVPKDAASPNISDELHSSWRLSKSSQQPRQPTARGSSRGRGADAAKHRSFHDYVHGLQQQQQLCPQRPSGKPVAQIVRSPAVDEMTSY